MAKIYLLLCLLLIASAVVDATSPRKHVGFYQIKKGDFSVNFTNWGATVVSVLLPDSKGNIADVVLGYDTIGPYLNDTTYFGALVGRVANRIGGAQFTQNGIHYRLVANEGKNTLHGGHRGFGDVIWTVTEHNYNEEFPYITFHYRSFDGEQGFPGDVDLLVTYKIVTDYSMSVTMTAKALNKPTPVNLAQHTYWNLAGHDNGDILMNTVQLFASHYTPVDDELIPTGDILAVEGTPYDFRQPHTVGSRIAQTPFGYDYNYALDQPADLHGNRKAAVVKDNKSGRTLELWTNQVGLQFYTGNKLDATVGKGGHVYKVHAAMCLETQGFPDAVNRPYLPSQTIYPGKDYRHYMLYKFSFKEE